MEQPKNEDEARLAALCNRLGRLWSEQQIEVCDEAAPREKIEECRLILVGKILTNPSINFQAF